MRIVLQRVSSASIEVKGEIVSKISKGLLIFIGIHKNDTGCQVDQLAKKLIHLRIFEDDSGKMNYSLKDIGGEVLVVSQFTLYGNCSKGRRPDFLEAASGEIAEPLYLKFIEEVSKELKVQKGIFGAFMKISLVNDGPLTMMIETEVDPILKNI